MWVYLSDAFLSIVAHRSQPDALLVRARLKGDIESVFSGYEVEHTPSADYAYRAVIPRFIVASKMAELAGDIEYDNFKGSVVNHDRHDVYIRVWSATRHESAKIERVSQISRDASSLD